MRLMAGVMRATGAVLIFAMTFAGCFHPVAELEPEDAAVVIAEPPDASVDAGLRDAGVPDASIDAGAPDAGTPDASIDAGLDAGMDAGVADAGFDGGHDAGALLGRLWFLRTAVPMLPQVFVQAPAGSDPKLMSAPGRGVTNMLVSKDGSMIAIAYPGANHEIFVGPTDGGPARLVWSQPGDRVSLIAMSPDESQLAFYEENHGKSVVLVLPLDGGAAVEGTPRVNPVNWYELKARFSPSSRFLAVSAGELSSDFDAGLYVTDTSSRVMAPVQLPWSIGSTRTRFGWFEGDRFVANAFHPTSGSTLVVCDAPSSCTLLPEHFDAGLRLVDEDRLHVAGNGAFVVLGNSSVDAGVRSLNIFRAPLDGGVPAFVGSMPDQSIWGTALTPDGARLVVFATTSDFVTPRDLDVYSFTLNVPSSVTRLSAIDWPVLKDPVGDSESIFEPGARHLVFRKADPGVSFQLWRLDLRTSMQTPVLQQQGELWGEQFEWTP